MNVPCCLAMCRWRLPCLEHSRPLPQGHVSLRSNDTRLSPEGLMDHDGTHEVRGTVTGRAGDPLRQARVVVCGSRSVSVPSGRGETSETDSIVSTRFRERAPACAACGRGALEFLDDRSSRCRPGRAGSAIDLNVEPHDQSEWATLVGRWNRCCSASRCRACREQRHQDLVPSARNWHQDRDRDARRGFAPGSRPRSRSPRQRFMPSSASGCRRACPARSLTPARVSRSSSRWCSASAR